MTTRRDLFGGAIVVSIPSDWLDVSLVRQVPDFQEVFQSADEVFVVEILERQQHIANQDAAQFFLRDLIESSDDDRCANGNDGMNDNRIHMLYNQTRLVGTFVSDDFQEIRVMPNVSIPRATACSAIAWHSDAKSPNTYFFIESCVLRMESLNTDLLMTVTKAIQGEESKSLLIRSFEDGHSRLFSQILDSFSIIDYSLFSSP